MKKKHILSTWKTDLPASLVVYLVALPLCLGVAFASTDVQGISGVPNLFSGIIAGVVGGIVVGALSGSRLGVSGPAAGLITIVAGALATLGSFEAFLLAVFLSGVIQLVAGFLKAGVIGHYFPSSVIKGMLAAIGLTLILKEIPHLVGYDADPMGEMDFIQPDGHTTFSELFYAANSISYGAVIISILSLVILLVMDRPYFKRIALFTYVPGALFVVVIGILLNFGFSMFKPEWYLSGKHVVELPIASGFNEFIGFFRSPDFTFLTNPDVYVIAFTLAIVGSLESLLSVEATDKLDPLRHVTPTNRELKAQGMGNMLSGLIGGLPITQVIVRSSANINAGGQSKLSTMMHGVILLGSVILIPQVLNMIPLASLGAILFLVGYKLSKLSLYRMMYKLGWEQFLPFVSTIVVVLLTDLLKGIAFGMIISIFFILRKNYQNNYNRETKIKDGREVICIKLSEEVTFLNKGSIIQTLQKLPDNSIVIIDGSNSTQIDYDVLEVIEEFRNFGALERNIEFSTINIETVEVMGH
jgi:MFS superfamily sulfate permease-like transporter